MSRKHKRNRHGKFYSSSHTSLVDSLGLREIASHLSYSPPAPIDFKIENLAEADDINPFLAGDLFQSALARDTKEGLDKIAYWLSEQRWNKGFPVKEINDQHPDFSEERTAAYAKWDWSQAEAILAAYHAANSEAEKQQKAKEEKVAAVLETLPPITKEAIGKGFWNIGYSLREKTNGWLKKISASASKRITNDFLKRHLSSVSEVFAKKEEDAKQIRENKKEGFLKKAGSASIVISTLTRWGRVLHGYGLNNPIRIAMMGSMAAGFLADVEKGARSKSRAVIEKGRVEDVERAQEEAHRIYEEAKKISSANNKENPSSVDLKKAYDSGILKDVMERIRRRNIRDPHYMYECYHSLADERIENAVIKLNNQLVRLDKNQQLAPQQKETARQELLRRHSQFLKDVDVIMSDAGAVDQLLYYSNLASKGAKIVTTALTLETLAEGAYRLWQHADVFEQQISSLWKGKTVPLPAPSGNSSIVEQMGLKGILDSDKPPVSIPLPSTEGLESKTPGVPSYRHPEIYDVPPHSISLSKPEISTSGPLSSTEGLETKIPGVKTYQPEVPPSAPQENIDIFESRTPDERGLHENIISGASGEDVSDIQKLTETTPPLSSEKIEPGTPTVSVGEIPPSTESRALRSDEWMLQGEPEARHLKPEEYMLQGVKHADYQGDRSIWKEAELQLQARFSGIFDSLGGDTKAREALRTFNIDRIKDEIIEHPEKYGLPKNFDGRRLSKEMITNIKWDSAFDRAFPQGILTDKLSPEQISHILEVNGGETVPEVYILKEIPAPDNLPVVEEVLKPTFPTPPVSMETPLAPVGESESSSVFRPAPPPEIPSENAADIKISRLELSSSINHIVSQSTLEKESTERVLSNLGLTRPADAAAASHFVATAEFANLPPETVARYPEFALSPDLSPRTAASIVNLLEHDTTSRVREMEIKRILAYFSQHYRGLVSEGAVSNGPVKKLELFFTPSGSGRRPFEVTITKDGFSIGGVRHPLRQLDQFLNRPESFLGAGW